MNLFFAVVGIVSYISPDTRALRSISFTARRYQSANSVANSYDQWTEDGILEFYWGEHIHLGHYGLPPRRKDFLTAKSDFSCMKWCVGEA